MLAWVRDSLFSSIGADNDRFSLTKRMTRCAASDGGSKVADQIASGEGRLLRNQHAEVDFGPDANSRSQPLSYIQVAYGDARAFGSPASG